MQHIGNSGIVGIILNLEFRHKKRSQMAKETTIMQEKICYCFNYTAADLEKDVMEHGRSTIMERITAESKQGNCDCKNNNPKGR